MTQKEKDIKRLIKHIAKEDVALFLGSGFSLKAGAPSVRDLKEAILKEGGDDFAEEIGELRKISLADLTEKFVEFNGGSRNELISLLQTLFQIKSSDNSDHAFLRLIPQIQTIYTTNYETFIEDSFTNEDIQVVNSNEACAYVGKKPVTLYKIHGDLSTLHSPDSVVITSSDYKAYFKGKKFEQLWSQFKTDIAKHHILFIGYSLEDPNILNIIKTARTQIGSSVKEMFLVAPGMNSAKVGQIKKYVTYIDAKAEDILPKILESLKDSVNDDFKHKRISAETHSRFCAINGNLQPEVSIGQTENRVTDFNALNGANLKHELTFRLPERIDFNDPSSYNSFMTFGGTQIKIPSIKIPRSGMTSFVHTLNSIALAHKDDIGELLIGPATDSLAWVVKLDSMRFKEHVNGCRYHIGDFVHIKLQTPVYVIHMYQETDGWRIEFNFNEVVPSISEALRWIDFLIESTKQKTMCFNDFRIKSEDDMTDLLIELDKIRYYFEVLGELEFTYNQNFKKIDNYNEHNLTNAVIVLSYLSKKSIRHALDNDGHFGFNVDDRKLNGTIPILKTAGLMLTRQDKLGNISLCGINYDIKYVITIYNDIKVNKCEPVPNTPHMFYTEFQGCINTEDILAVDNLTPDFVDNVSTWEEGEGVALFYKPGERTKYGIA